ncbi:hypothetical protein [Aliiruegeria lutimaris]|uniref:Uncharacterized protein n=1 Tax=Aliiruegeria lutimaris TaxID=571298 RepID=A0A1G8VRC5_9RHOB|nr:hypothetical protein [Aliiruegeria lutimaris]SDJ68544.1 hypothetical protein SAMN04488026_102210 [Aliiruegeria lutimaris]
MEKTLTEIEHEAYRLRNELIRETARDFSSYLKRKIGTLVSLGASPSAAQAK